MAETQTSNLESIFTKLGHEVEEIRVRALSSLLSKLDHRVISDADLVQEQHLLIRLLEWFNFKECSKKQEVLALIHRLAKHSSAAEQFVRIGAVQFLSQLRYDVEGALQTNIDSILEVLLSLPDQMVTDITQEYCLYDVHPHDVTDTGANIVPDSVSQGVNMVMPEVADGYFPHLAPSPPLGMRNRARKAVAQDKSAGGICGVIFSTFPWLPLTATDVHVLTSTNNSLCSNQAQVVVTSCDFINDVVLHDFPAEIFLQRPSIIQSLFALLANHRQDVEDKNQVTQHAVQCLINISLLLMARFQFYHDPALYCPKQDFLSTTNSSASSGGGEQSHSTVQSTLSSESRPSIIGRTNRRVSGDGRDWDSNSSMGSSPLLPEAPSPPQSMHADPETDSDDTIILQFSQITLPQFALETMHYALALLKSLGGVSQDSRGVGRDAYRDASKDACLTTLLVQLLQRALGLLGVAVTSDLWQNSSVSGRLLTDMLSDCLEMLGCLITHHCQRAADDSHMTSQQREHHINIYQVLASFVVDVINKFVPLPKAQDLLPEELASTVGSLLIDVGMAVASPDQVHRLEPYTRTVSPDQASLYSDIQQVSASIRSACDLVKGKKSLEFEDQVQLAQEACVSWPVHGMVAVIDALIHVCVQVCKSGGDSRENGLIRDCRDMLLQYLSHPEEQCRLLTYRACFNVVKTSLEVKKAVLPGSKVSDHVTFLLDPCILHEVTCYGLDDPNKEVQQCSKSIILHLLQGRLLMSCALWGRLLQACIPIMPLLQCQSASHPTVSQCANHLINQSLEPEILGSQSRLPALEQIRGALRMMLSKDFRLRTEGAASLMWHLLQEPGSEGMRPSLSPPPAGFEDLFIFHTRVSLENHNGTSVFKEDGLLQVLNIFTSENTERDLKKSALQQMAIILQDNRLHHGFVSHGGLNTMLDTLQTIVSKSSGSTTDAEFVPALVSILRHLVESNGPRRRELANMSALYLQLLRASLICRSSEEARQEIAHLLVFLLFDEVITMVTDEQEGSRKACLPKPIIEAFQLPFRCGLSSPVRPHRLTPRPSPDPLRQPEAWARIKLEWLLAWCTSPDNLECMLEERGDRIIPVEYSQDLQLSPQERTLLAVSYPPTALQQSLRSIHSATSHYEVKQSIWQMSLMIHWASLQQGRGDGDAGGSGSLTRSLLSFDWKAALKRFLEVTPANTDDEQLLAQIIALLSHLLRSHDLVTPDLVEWVGSFCVGGRSSLVELLRKYPPAGQMGEGQQHGEGGGKGKESSLVRKEVLKLLTAFVQTLPVSQDAWRRKGMFLGGTLVHSLLGSLDLADALHFYDLPSLESTLHCLVHITARPGWSLDWAEGDSLTLCQQMLTSLQEVVSAFHVGRGGTAMSYMGKGVTKSATLCLLHLTREIAARAVDKSWPLDWLYTSKGTAEQGFAWLTPLLSYRDPEVRAAGLGIAASLASSEQGCLVIAKCFQHRTGGVWGLGLSVLLDHSECSVVRQQAAAFLANLVLQPFGSDDQSKGQGTDQQSQIGVAGVSAVLALLQYHRFFPEIAVMLTHYYPDSTIQPISIVEDSTLPSTTTQSGPPTLTTPDSTDNEGAGFRSTDSRRAQAQQNLDRERRLNEQRSPEGRSISSSHDTMSVSSSETGRGRYESVVTPGLVTATATLLTNLLAALPTDALLAVSKENILHSFHGLINIKRIHDTMIHSEPSSIDSQPSYINQVQLIRQITMCSSVFRFLLACLQHDAPLCLDAMHDGKVVIKCCQVFALPLPEQGDVRLSAGLYDLQRSAFDLLTVLCQLSGIQNLMPTLTDNWTIITNCMMSVLRNPCPAPTRIAALNLLAVILILAEEEGGREECSNNDGGLEENERPTTNDDDEDDNRSSLARLLDVQNGPDGIASGSELCEVLLKAHDGTLPRSTGPNLSREKPAVLSSLKVLLAISHSAKTYALEAGLVETTVDSIKQIHTKLTLESLHVDKTTKKKEEPMFQRLLSSFDLLNSFMVDSHSVKMAAHQAGLSQAIHKLWAWLGLDDKLLALTLSLLTTYTARCPTVCGVIASCNPGQTGNSILHYLVRLVDRERLKGDKLAKSPVVLQRTFAALGNLVWYGECRNVLWKSGFLASFKKVSVPRSSKQTKTVVTSNLFAALWLQLLTNLTFANEGQQMIMKMPGALDLLIDFSLCGLPNIQESALLVLHNLCYLPVSKTRLLANDKLVHLFLTTLTSGSLQTQLTVTSALYALIYDSQKAKALLKPSRLYLSLQELEGALLKEIQQPQPPANLDEVIRQDMANRCHCVTSYIMTLLQD